MGKPKHPWWEVTAVVNIRASEEKVILEGRARATGPISLLKGRNSLSLRGLGFDFD